MDHSISGNIPDVENKKFCIQSRNVSAIVELRESDPLRLKQKDHLENCSICASSLARAEREITHARKQIPQAVRDKEIQDSFNRELGEIFKNFSTEVKRQSPLETGTISLFSAESLLTIIRVLLSRDMIVTYALALLTGLTLQYLL